MEHLAAAIGVDADAIPVKNLLPSGEGLPFDCRSFHDFPKSQDWTLDHSYKLLPGSKPCGLSILIQAWLFYGLIFTIVQINGEPILSFDDLAPEKTSVDNGESVRLHVSTEKLADALARWENWEFCNREGIRLRMVRAERVLDIARRTVRTQFSYEDRDGDPVSQRDPTYVSDDLALCIMTIGEALSARKVIIMQKTISELRGWHSNDDSGWGQPRYVFQKMKKEKWCPRSIHIWRSQFRSHATLLFATYSAYEKSGRFKGDKHHRPLKGFHPCDQNNCYVVSVDEAGGYSTAHAHDCSGNCGKPIGPDMREVQSFLDKGNVPLLHFLPSTDETKNPQLTVIAKRPVHREKYATISHVWSDGFGNENENKLHVCQLQFIQRQLLLLAPPDERFEDVPDTPFWMDTLVIPVQKDKEAQRLRKQAIGDIHEVFRDAKYTIVLDAGLLDMSPGRAYTDPPVHAATRILASSWMRRLWTLQEAYLSRKIHFAFSETDHSDVQEHLPEFQMLSKGLKIPTTKYTTAILAVLDEHMRHNIMDHERITPSNDSQGLPKSLSSRQVAGLVSNAWKATTWRTTTNYVHETLALATLLDLDYRNTKIEELGLTQEEQSQRKKIDDMTRKREAEIQGKRKDDLMKQFWAIFNRKWPHSIPPGIIFLPGDRIEKQGFGWAPRTWMSASPTDFPDPLSLLTSTSELHLVGDECLNGLKVRYPGFLLETKDRSQVLSTNKEHGTLYFPTGPGLLDWYAIEAAEDKAHPYLEEIRTSKKPLAIIISRPKPADIPTEIGLLVQIWDEKMMPKPHISHLSGTVAADVQDTPYEPQDPTTGLHDPSDYESVFFCEIIHRVRVKRETRDAFRLKNQGRMFEHAVMSDDGASHRPSPLIPGLPGGVPEIMVNTHHDAKICIAEELSSDQVWFVDGYFHNRGHTKTPVSQPTTPPPLGKVRDLAKKTQSINNNPSQYQPNIQLQSPGTFPRSLTRDNDLSQDGPKLGILPRSVTNLSDKIRRNMPKFSVQIGNKDKDNRKTTH